VRGSDECVAPRSTTSTLHQYPISGTNQQATAGAGPHGTHLSGGSVSEQIVVRVPPRHTPGPPAVLSGLLPRTGVTIAVLLALVALLLVALGASIARLARWRTE